MDRRQRRRRHTAPIALASTLGAALLTVGLAACGSDDSSTDSASSEKTLSGSITGAGATFPQPVYTEWAADLKEQGLTVNYQGIGSGGGIAQFTAGTVDFGATDSAMDDDELKEAQAKGEPVHIPSVFGAVRVSQRLSILKLEYRADRRLRPFRIHSSPRRWCSTFALSASSAAISSRISFGDRCVTVSTAFGFFGDRSNVSWSIADASTVHDFGESARFFCSATNSARSSVVRWSPSR